MATDPTKTVAQVVEAWQHYRFRMMTLQLVQASTLDNQDAIAAVIIAGIGAIPVDELRKSDIDLFIGERLQTHAPVTVRGELNVLRQILNWAVDEQLLGARPRLPMVQVPNVEAALPGEAAFLWALAAVPDNHRLALEFLMLTGLSPHEAERLQVRDWRANPADYKGPGAIAIGMRSDFRVKTAARRRIVPLNARAQMLWQQMTDGLPPLATALPKGGTMQKALARARAADPAAPEGSSRITPKMMRQWFASQVAADDVPEHILQRLMGHSPGSKITRQHYVRSSDAAMSSAVAGVSA